MQSDGCSGFWWAESVWPIRECCVAHDGGASDGGYSIVWQMPECH